MLKGKWVDVRNTEQDNENKAVMQNNTIDDSPSNYTKLLLKSQNTNKQELSKCKKI